MEYYDTMVQTCDMVTRYVSLFSIWLHNIDTGFELILLTKPTHVELTVYQTQWLEEKNGAIQLLVEQQLIVSSWSYDEAISSIDIVI